MTITRPLPRLAAAAALTVALLGAGAAPAAAGPGPPAGAAAPATAPAAGDPAPANVIVGTTVCHRSLTLGWQCGTVVAVNQTIILPDGPVFGVFQYTACSAPGDEGIAVFARDRRVGTVVAGAPATCRTYALPYPPDPAMRSGSSDVAVQDKLWY